MSRDPLEEMEKKIKEMMEEGMSGSGKSISIKQTGEGTTVDIGADVSDCIRGRRSPQHSLERTILLCSCENFILAIEWVDGNLRKRGVEKFSPRSPGRG